MVDHSMNPEFSDASYELCYFLIKGRIFCYFFIAFKFNHLSSLFIFFFVIFVLRKRGSGNGANPMYQQPFLYWALTGPISQFFWFSNHPYSTLYISRTESTQLDNFRYKKALGMRFSLPIRKNLPVLHYIGFQLTDPLEKKKYRLT